MFLDRFFSAVAKYTDGLFLSVCLQEITVLHVIYFVLPRQFDMHFTCTSSPRLIDCKKKYIFGDINSFPEYVL
jgi:hypothetical protein